MKIICSPLLHRVRVPAVLLGLCLSAACANANHREELREALHRISLEYCPGRQEGWSRAIRDGARDLSWDISVLDATIAADEASFAEKETAAHLFWMVFADQETFRRWASDSSASLRAAAVISWSHTFDEKQDLMLLDSVVPLTELAGADLWTRLTLSRWMLLSGRLNRGSFSCLVDLCNVREMVPEEEPLGLWVARQLEHWLGHMGCPRRARLLTKEGQDEAMHWWLTVEDRLIRLGEGGQPIGPRSIPFRRYELQ